MPTLENDNLVFRFPQTEPEAKFSINFQRTLRIPDTERTYSLPPGLGAFPIRHAQDFPDKLPQSTLSRGGVVLPIWQAEAMWLSFQNQLPEWGLPFPVAIKVAAGKINAVSGEAWRSGLNRDPQDYMVSPDQPWLDGFAIAKGVIRQFVAMPLGEGYSVEEQLTGEAEWGGLQISVAPLKAHAWQAKRAKWAEQQAARRARFARFSDSASPSVGAPAARAAAPMALGAGGRMRQHIYPDTFQRDDWDLDAADRVFVTLLHAKDWKTVTGERAPNEPPTAQDYTRAGLPWFDAYGADQTALDGGARLKQVKTVAETFKQQTGATLPNSENVKLGFSIPIFLRWKKPRTVNDTDAW